MAKSFDIDVIEKLLPHRYPFLLIDKVLDTSAEHQIALKNVTYNEPFFQGHFPGYPVMPGVLQIEAIAQASGLMVLLNDEEGADAAGKYDTLFMSIDGAKFRKVVRPGDQLKIETKLLMRRRHAAKVQGTIYVDDQVVTEATLMFILVPKDARSNA